MYTSNTQKDYSIAIFLFHDFMAKESTYILHIRYVTVSHFLDCESINDEVHVSA